MNRGRQQVNTVDAALRIRPSVNRIIIRFKKTDHHLIRAIVIIAVTWRAIQKQHTKALLSVKILLHCCQ